MSTIRSNTSTRDLINGRMPVITLSAFNEDGSLTPFLPGVKLSTFVKQGSANSAALLAASDDMFRLKKNAASFDDAPDSMMAVVRIQTNKDSDRPEYADTGVLVEVLSEPKKSANGLYEFSFVVDDFVGIDGVATELLQTMIPGVPEMEVDRGDISEISALKNIDSYDIEHAIDVVKASIASYASLRNQFIPSDPIPEVRLNALLKAIDKDPITEINNFISSYAYPLESAIGQYKTLAIASADPKSYVRLAANIIDIYATQELGQLVNVEGMVSEAMRAEIEKLQRENGLRMQRIQLEAGLKKIAEELGEDDSDVEEYKRLFEEKKEAGVLPEAVIRECEDLISKVERNPSAMTNESSKNVLDIFLKSFPFGVTEIDRPNLEEATALLDEHHYGLEDAKDRILDQIAVDLRRAKKDAGYTGKPLLLIGPKGIGKTTLAKSIAAATGRPLAFLPFGGVSDPAELRGHGRTYIGSKQGSVVKAFEQAGHQAPLLFIDEIDKSGKDMRGNPQEVLMALTDPSQNKTFKDNFLEIPMDLSAAKMIATANHYDRIDPILLDRFEVIHLGEYSVGEKMVIARKFILPRMMKESGLEDTELNLSDAVLEKVIKGYTREPGVRQLEARIKEVCEKTVRRLSGTDGQSVAITEELLETKEWFDLPLVQDDEVPSKPTIGWVNGLYGSSSGGGVLPIKSKAFKSLNGAEASITHTGRLQTTMQESLVNVSTVVKVLLDDLKEPDQNAKDSFIVKWRKETDFHIEAVGNSKVDGPSAGVTMTTAIMSQICQLPVDSSVAMTGKIDIHGKVHAIGGLEQKIPAARDVGIKTVIVPRENERDVKRLKPEITEGVNIVFADDIREVLKIAIPGIEKIIDISMNKPMGAAPANQNDQNGRQPIGFDVHAMVRASKASAKKLTP